MPYGYTDKQGNRIFFKQNDSKHWSQTGGVQNLTFEQIAPQQPKTHGWICGKEGAKMTLLPISHDIPAEYWECNSCQRQITIEERDGVFETIRQNIQTEYLLKTFEYDKLTNKWTIESSEWIGISRIGAKRRVFTAGMRQDLIEQLLSTIEDTLSIHVGINMKDYFIE
jgi:hypothetical protein